MHLVEVDVVHSQVAQALLDALAQPSGRGVAQEVVAVGPQPALGGDHQVVAALAQLVAEAFAQELLGLPKP